ncbi:MAG TPA: SAM-dependent methyltransferase [Polyangiaceae bacterium]
MRSKATVLPFLLLVTAACGGGAPASVPPHLDIPVPPEARPVLHASRLPSEQPSRPVVKGPEPMRPPQTKVPVSPAIQAIVDAPDRDAEDRKLDAGRHPGELLAFLGLRPGDRVGEIAAGGGYTTELLARAVGPRGRVWAENNAFIVKLADKAIADRLKRPADKNVVRSDRELDAPFPPDAKNLDAVVDVLFYHDTVWMGGDRDRMNKAIFDALRHGGEYVVVDHSAPEGSGTEDVKTTHRIDELFVIREIEKAGFHHVASADFLRNPADTRDWNDSPRAAGERRGTSDRFVLKFIRP